MSTARWTAVALFLLTSSYAAAERLHYDFEISGSNIGGSDAEIRPDGSFDSKSWLKIGAQEINTTITGQLKDAKLVSAKYDLKVGKTKVEVEFANDKFTTKVDGSVKVKDQAFPQYEGLYSNYHPILARTIAVALGKNSKAKLKVFSLDAGTALPVSVSWDAPVRVTSTTKGVTNLQKFTVDLSGLQIQYVLTPDGDIAGEAVPAQTVKFVAKGYENVFVDPLAKYPELSQPTFREIKFTEKEMVPMRDGVKLATTISSPATPRKYPAILIRTPYGRSSSSVTNQWLVNRGYVVVTQDVRGREGSEGEFDPFVFENQDGKDTLDWIVAQPWSDGKVGMIGGSYLGYVQWAAAKSMHPALKCIVPQVSPPDVNENLPYEFGTMTLFGDLWWSRIVVDKKTNMGAATAAMPHPEKLTTLPLSKVDQEAMGQTIPMFQKWLDREQGWGDLQTIGNVGSTTIPAFHISGWFDGDGIGTKLNWARRRAAGHNDQWLIYGPWVHAFNTTRKMGDVDYGEGAILELDSNYLRFFDTYLKGKSVGWDKMPRVRAFVTGLNKWRTMPDWPSKLDKDATLYLGGGGTLLNNPQPGAPQSYTYDPGLARVPEEFKKGQSMGDASLVYKEEKGDQARLFFRLPKSKAPFGLAGPISLDLYFKSTAKDADFYATLMDEDEKGVRRVFCQPGKIRASFLGGSGKKKPIEPGKVYRAELKIWDTAHVILPGHRLVLMIRSDMFPNSDRNLGTGEPIKNATKFVVAKQTIFMDKEHPSALRFKKLDLSQGF